MPNTNDTVILTTPSGFLVLVWYEMTCGLWVKDISARILCHGRDDLRGQPDHLGQVAYSNVDAYELRERRQQATELRVT
jgi:hypothetical protein